MKRHSYAPSLGRSDVGSAQGTAIRFAKLNVAFSALAAIGTGRVLRRQYGGQLTMAASSNSTAASCISELTLSTRCCRSSRCSSNGRYQSGPVIPCCHSRTSHPPNRSPALNSPRPSSNDRFRAKTRCPHCSFTDLKRELRWVGEILGVQRSPEEGVDQ